MLQPSLKTIDIKLASVGSCKNWQNWKKSKFRKVPLINISSNFSLKTATLNPSEVIFPPYHGFRDTKGY